MSTSAAAAATTTTRHCTLCFDATSESPLDLSAFGLGSHDLCFSCLDPIEYTLEQVADTVRKRLAVRKKYDMQMDVSAVDAVVHCFLCDEDNRHRFVGEIDLSDILMDAYPVCDLCVDYDLDDNTCAIADAIQDRMRD